MLTILLQAITDVALSRIGAVFAAVLAAFAGAYGISKIGVSAMETIARQPESAGDVRSSMIVVTGMIEGATLFAIIVCLLVVVL